MNRLLFCAVLICACLYFASQILIPVMFAVFFAMLFAPLCNRMERIRIKRGLAAFISLLIIVVAVAGIGLLIYMQSKKLADKWPQIEKKSSELLRKSQKYVSEKLNVPEKKQDEMINKRMKSMMQSSGQTLKKAFSGLFSTLAMFVLILVFTFLFLLQRDKYEAFFVQLGGGSTKPDESKKLIHDISSVAHGYLTGRLMSVSIFAILFTIGFSIVGLEGAFLLAFVAALLTIIPYIGSILGGFFAFAVALVTGDTNMALATLCVVLAVNIMDNYLIEPNIIGGEVQLNAFWTILILLVGGTLWGIAGMVLFLPMLAMTKIIFDFIPELKPYAYLLGDQRQERPSKALFGKIAKLFGKKDK